MARADPLPAGPAAGAGMNRALAVLAVAAVLVVAVEADRAGPDGGRGPAGPALLGDRDRRVPLVNSAAQHPRGRGVFPVQLVLGYVLFGAAGAGVGAPCCCSCW